MGMPVFEAFLYQSFYIIDLAYCCNCKISQMGAHQKRLQAESEDSDSTEYQIPQVSLIDERLTTVSAHRQLFEAHKASNKHRPVVDQQSAVVILQTALDRTREQ